MSTARLLLALVLVLHAPAGTAWAADDAPIGRGKTGDGSTAFTGLGSAPEANLFHGAATMSVPIQVPPGRGPITPRLALSYSSSGRMSPYGFGWDLALGTIQRSTRRGVPTCGDVGDLSTFVIHLPGSVSECRIELDPNDASIVTNTQCEPLVRQTAIDIQYDSAVNSWTVRDVSGLEYSFGTVRSARVGSEVEDLYSANGTSCTYTFGWGLSRIEDLNGNHLDVVYGDPAAPESGVLYPARVEYGGNLSTGLAHLFQVEFDWSIQGPSEVPWVNAAGGFEAKIDRLLAAIRVISYDAVPYLRKYELSYAHEAGMHPGAPPLLAQVALFGRDGLPLIGEGGSASTTLIYQDDAGSSF